MRHRLAHDGHGSRASGLLFLCLIVGPATACAVVRTRGGQDRTNARIQPPLRTAPSDSRPLLLTPDVAWRGGTSLSLLGKSRGWRGGGVAGAPPVANKTTTRSDVKPGTMESDELLAGNVQRLQFLRKKTGMDLGVTVFTLYAMAIRSVIATVGQPLRAATERRAGLFSAAQAEKGLVGDAAAAAASALSAAETLDDAGGPVGAAAEAYAREMLERLPFPYLPSVGALLLVAAAVAAHTLLVLGKKWSVRFHAWSSFEEVLTWEQADAVLVTPVRHAGTPAICPLVNTGRSREEMPPEEEVRGKGSGGDCEESEEDAAGASSDLDVATSDPEATESPSESLASEEADDAEGTSRVDEGEKENGVKGVGVGADDELPSFVYQRRKFVLKRAPPAERLENSEDVDEREGKGGEGDGQDVGEVGDTFGLVELPIRWPLGSYLQASGLASEDVPSRLGLFGPNSVDVKQPTFWHHLVDRLTDPFVVFSIFNQILWMLEQYWTKALVSIGNIVGVEAMFVVDSERRRKQLDMRNANEPVKKVRAWRGGEWIAIPVSGMLPGDVVSLKSGVGSAGGDPRGVEDDDKGDQGAGDEEIKAEAAAFVVGELPADMLLLRGTAVVDESSLTGESVPQVKTSLTSEPIDFEDDLDMTGRHSSHVLLSGTTLLDQTDGSNRSGESDWSPPADTSSAASGSSALPAFTPDGGALCYVLRTGAYSFQGDLKRTIDFGNHGIRSDSKDSAYLVGFLVSFAALSSAHVVREGLRNGKVSGFRLLIQCIRILSAVVPGSLSFELNQCLRNGVLSLQKGHALACTEPFRVSLAGKVDVCLFDKTGTITSDKLRAETLVTPQPLHPNRPPVTVGLAGSSRRGGSAPVSELAAEVVIGGCHSLMDVDGVLHGDPLEASALDGIGWSWNATSHTARPRSGDADASNPVSVASEDSIVDEAPTKKSKERAGVGENGEGVGEGSGGVATTVWRRYAFSSQLQRMSVIAEVSGARGGVGAVSLTSEDEGPEAWVLSKGSPEAMRPLLDKGGLPGWYDSEYDRLARSGRRVVALAHRSLGPSRVEGAKSAMVGLSRTEVEKEGSLTFDGFLSFRCKTRADSKRVIRELREEGDCSVTIVTGDSLLTACHVAAEIGLIDGAPVSPAPTPTLPHKPSPAAVASEGSPESKDRESENSKDNDGKAASTTRSKRSGGRKARAKTEVMGKKSAAGNGDGGKNKRDNAAPAGKSMTPKKAPCAPTTEKRKDGDGGRGTEDRKAPLLLTVVPAEHGDELRWVPLYPGGAANTTRTDDIQQGAQLSDTGYRESLEFSWEDVAGLAATRDLCATGPAFELAVADGDPAIGSAVQHFRVLARMTPGLKEELATLLMDAGRTVLMCGDGSNDVGALRKSHVGLALLSGFGDANTRTDTDPAAAPAKGEEDGGAPDARESGGGVDMTMAAAQSKKRAAEILRKEREKIQADITAEFERLQSEGVGAGKALWQATVIINDKKKARYAARKQASRGAFAESAMAMYKDADASEGGQAGADGVVKTGDASLAAPFTSKKPSIVAVVDVVRQGRCTLAVILHTYQIVALQALFNSFSSSVLYLMGVRWPQRPLVLLSLLYAPMSLGLSSPQTPSEMSPVRPANSLFHRSTFVSLLGQACIHLACMVYALRVAKAHSPETLPGQTVKGLLGPVFQPNLVSNAVLLMSVIQSVSVSIVNYKGRPFMAGILESSSFFLPSVSIVACCFALVLEIMPRANELLQLQAFPSAAAKLPILAAMIVALAGPLAVDRLCVKLFDPELHKARSAGPPLKHTEKLNLGLLGLLLIVVALVVNNLDFDSLEETAVALSLGGVDKGRGGCDGTSVGGLK
eukprot:g17669.t1